MWFIVIPWILILIVVVGIGAGISSALSINIMPIISFGCLILSIIFIISAFKAEEGNKAIPVIIAAIAFLFFLFTIGANVSSGDILSWVWYHI